MKSRFFFLQVQEKHCTSRVHLKVIGCLRGHKSIVKVTYNCRLYMDVSVAGHNPRVMTDVEGPLS